MVVVVVVDLALAEQLKDERLRKWLRATGRANPDGIGRAIRIGRCGDCSRTVLQGLDADVAALPVRCEPQTITTTGEAFALIAGLATYRVQRHPRGLVLDRRRAAHIDKRSADEIDALHEHSCTTTFPPACYKPFELPRTLDDAPPF